MKKLLTLFSAILCFSVMAIAQKGKTAKPAEKNKVKPATTAAAKSNPWRIDFYTVKDDSGMNILSVQNGDKLVYHVTDDKEEYDLIITYKKHSVDKGIEFGYELTNDKHRSGNVKISPNAKKTADMYVDYFLGGNMDITEACSLWLSNHTAGDFVKNSSDISFDYNQVETFYRNTSAVPGYIINFKGKPYKLDTYTINNAADGTGKKTLLIHNSSINPLILKADIGMKIELKEIR